MTLTRRELLKLAAAVAVISVGGGGRARGEESMATQSVSIKDLGARGDGVADDTNAIQNAIEKMYNAGGGDVLIPATTAFYKTTRAINIHSDIDHRVRVVGEGDASFIKNVTTNGDNDHAPVFRPGLLVAGTGIHSAPGQHYVDMAPAGAGATVIKPVSGTYRRGQMLLIAGGARLYHEPRAEDWFPQFPQIVVVLDVDSAGVHISDPLLDDQPNAQVAIYPYGASYGAIRDLRFEQAQVDALGFGAIAAGGAYRMNFRNLNMSRGVSVFACNGIAKCNVVNVRGVVSKKGMEFARYSHSTVVRNVNVRPIPGRPDHNIMLYVPEASHRMLFDQCETDVRGFAPQNIPSSRITPLYGPAAFTSASRYNIFRRSRVLADKDSKGFSITGTADGKTLGNRIEDSEIVADHSDYVVRIATPGGVGTGHHVVTGSRLSGVGASADVVLGSGTNDCEITNNVVPQGIKNFGERNTISGNTAS